MSSEHDVPSDEEVRRELAAWEAHDPEFVRMMRETYREREISLLEAMRGAIISARAWKEKVRDLDSSARMALLREEFEGLKADVENRIEINRARYEVLLKKSPRTAEEETEFYELHLQFGAP